MFTDETKTTYKSTYQILKDIAEIYHDLTDKNQAALLEALAGKRGGQVLASVISDFSEVERAMNEMGKAAGSADAEMGIITESISYKLNALQQTWVGIVQDLVQRGTLNSVIELLTNISSIIASITEHSQGLLPIISGIGVAFAAKKATGWDSYRSGLMDNGSIKEIIKGYRQLRTEITMFNQAQANGVKVIDWNSGNIELNKYLKSVGNGTASMKGFAASLVTTKLAALGTQVAIAALDAAISMGLAFALSALVGAIMKAVNAQKELREEAYKASSTFKEEADSIEESATKYDELAQKLHSSNLTEDENRQVKQDLLSLQTDLNEQYGTEASHLDLINGKYQEQIDILKQLTAEKAKQFKKENRNAIEDANADVYSHEHQNITQLTQDASLVKHLQEKFGTDVVKGSDYGGNMWSIDVYADKGQIEDVLSEVYDEIEKYQKEHPLAVDLTDYDDIYDNISGYLSQYKKDEGLQQNKEIVQAAALADIALNEQWTEYYDRLETKVAEYNQALADGQGVEAAKQEVESLQQLITDSVDTSTDAGKAVQQAFDDIAAGINKEAEQAYEANTKINEGLQPFFDAQDAATNLADLKAYLAQEKAAMEALKLDPNQTTFGNIDLNDINRNIEWTTSNILKYQAALESWGGSAWDYLGSHSTVDGMSDNIDGVEIAFTPIFTHDGQSEYLDKDTVYKYLHQIVKNANGDTSLENLLKLDAEGIEIDGKKIQGIIADVGETARKTGESMHYLGVDGAVQYTERQIEELEKKLNSGGLVQTYLNQIKAANLQDFEITDNFDNLSARSKTAFNSLMALLGLTKEDLGELVKKLVELGIVQSETYSKAESGIQNVNATIVDSVETLNSKLKPQMDALASAYNAIFNGEDGFDKSVVSTEMMKGISDAFKDAEEDVNAFFDVLTDESSTATDVQNAFNDLATAYFDSSVHLADLNDETAEAIQQQMEQMGIINADEVVQYYQGLAAAQQLAIDNNIDLATVSANTIASLVDEGIASEETAEAMYQLAYQEQMANENSLDSSESIAQLYALALQAGESEEVLEALLDLIKSFATAETYIKKGTDDAIKTGENIIQRAQERFKKVYEEYGKKKPVEIEVKPKKNTRAHSGAGREQADAYVEAYEKELKKLDELKENGLITESQYLDRLKALNERYFRDNSKYAEKYALVSADYMKKLKSHYDSVISGITTLLSRRIANLQSAKEKAIKAINEEKDAHLKALEKEKKAMEDSYKSRIKSIDKQIKAYQHQQKAIQKQIDKHNEEIDAINKANEARQDAMALQKAEYELQQALNQRSRLVYTGETGQMVYERDESTVREKRETIEEQKKEAEIKLIEKKIEALDKEVKKYDELIEALEEQKESLQEAMDNQTEYYDKMIAEAQEMYEEMLKSAEQYWDDLIEKLEQTKSKWEQLAEIETVAQAWGLVSEEMEKLGFTVEDVLNDVPGAFDAFKNQYVNVLTQMHDKDQHFLDGVKAVTGGAVAGFNEMNGTVGASKDAIGKLAESTQDLSKTASNINTLANSLQGVADSTSSVQTNSKNVATNFQNLGKTNEDISKVKSELDEIVKYVSTLSGDTGAQLTSKINTLKGYLTTIHEDLDGIVTDLTTLDGEHTGTATLANNFKAIAEAVESVSKALGTSIEGGAATQSAAVNTLVGAIQSLQKVSLSSLANEFGTLASNINKATSAINGQAASASGGGGNSTVAQGTGTNSGATSTGAENGSLLESLSNIETEGKSHVQALEGEFTNLDTKVKDVASKAIGTKEAEADDGTLDGAITGLDEHSADKVDGSITPRFEKLKGVLGQADQQIKNMKTDIEALDGSEATVTVHIEVDGEIPSFVSTGNYTGTAYVGQYYKGTALPHKEGMARLAGDWGVKQSGQSLVGELGQEIVVDSKTGRFRTVGDNGPEMTWLNAGDIVFNHLQSKQLLSKKNLVLPSAMKGRAFVSGSAYSAIPKSSSVMTVQDKLHSILNQVVPNITELTKAVSKQTAVMKQSIEKISTFGNSQSKPSVTVNNPQFTVSGVTGEEVMRKIEGSFEGLMLEAYQKSMK